MLDFFCRLRYNKSNMGQSDKLIWQKSLILGFSVLLLLAAVFLPILAIPFAPLLAAAIAVLFLIKSKLFYVLSAFTLCLPLFGYGDTITVIALSLIAVTAAAVIVSMRIKKHLLAAGLVIIMSITGFTAPALIYLTVNHFTVEDPSNGRFVSSYIKQNAERIDIRFLSDWYYMQKPEDGSIQLEKTNEGYQKAANDYFAALYNRWAEELLFEFLLGYGAMTAILSFLTAYFLQKKLRRRALPQLEPSAAHAGPIQILIDPFAVSVPLSTNSRASIAEEPESEASVTTQCSVISQTAASTTSKTAPKPEFIQITPFSITALGLGRKYVLYIFLPTSLFAFLGYIDWLAPATTAFFQAFVVVPCFFAALSLFLYGVIKIPKKGLRIGAIVFVAILGVFGIIFSPAMLLFSLFGLADAILNVRKLLDYALS